MMPAPRKKKAPPKTSRTAKPSKAPAERLAGGDSLNAYIREISRFKPLAA